MTARNLGKTTVLQAKTVNNLGPRHFVGLLPARIVRIIFKMRGWNPTTASFEYWLSSNANAGPPTAHILQNVAIAAILDGDET